MDPASTAGLWLLVAGAVAIVVELALLVPRAVRLSRRVRELQALIKGSRAEVQAQLETLRAETEELQRLLKPYRRAIRWLRHPLTQAVLESRRLRRARRRAEGR